jgi:hypothetical protein
MIETKIIVERWKIWWRDENYDEETKIIVEKWNYNGEVKMMVENWK